MSTERPILFQDTMVSAILDDEEAQREGFADRAAFLDLWRRLRPDYIGTIYRVAFRRIEGVTRG